ncbi:winged helix-turn-helix transcriptional regulator [Sinomicrobium weinanense]|uniref:Helix-turn-helix transcriptional regulator n=1 Tax=Sinomicrobium weinanense TaxID=2842200 RepID=A0A926Q4H9_9FLAO|nr:helix-turn-helix domain-containing protein [Sinomicrobium weinanense]MBC9798623.1 helix-turn-helix transcriptional regulator [Sinomicrobium weinanense]MBU3122484.1 helix-turn-helix transcriptional regulator [Sinomicrobium weinanense]
MAFPTPGKPVRGSRSGQPIMALFDLLGRSWAMGIIWHLSAGPGTFRALQEYCETISPTTLNKRIKELIQARMVTKTLEGYALTETGEELFKMLFPLGKWAKDWAQNLKENK